MNGKVYLPRAAARDAINVKPKVPATIMFNARLDSSRFMATLEANDTASNAMPVFVKYSSAISPSTSSEKTEVYASRTAEILKADSAPSVGDFGPALP